MTRHEKLAGRAAKLKQTQQAFMEGVQSLLGAAVWFKRPPATWRIDFGPPHCSSLGPSLRQERNGRNGVIHTVTVPKSWLEDVYLPGIARTGMALILGAVKVQCRHDGAEAWTVAALHPEGRKAKYSRNCFVVRFGGLTVWELDVEKGFSEIQRRIHRELGLAWEKRF